MKKVILIAALSMIATSAMARPHHYDARPHSYSRTTVVRHYSQPSHIVHKTHRRVQPMRPMHHVRPVRPQHIGYINYHPRPNAYRPHHPAYRPVGVRPVANFSLNVRL